MGGLWRVLGRSLRAPGASLGRPWGVVGFLDPPWGRLGVLGSICVPNYVLDLSEERTESAFFI